ncbi:MAG: hypothetical protein HY653_03590 [Acidobacteria bacterium]|nr:hypothetical protein [Acidobacteriota bacterium]
MNGSQGLSYVGGVLAALLLSLAGTAYGQEKPVEEAKPKSNCNAYHVDNANNRVYFNAPEPWIAIPTPAERSQLRVQGELGQLFVMQNCDTPDLIAKIPVLGKPESESGKPEPASGSDSTVTEIASGQPVLVLEQRGDWYRVKGRPVSVGAVVLWAGEGWVKTDKKTILVKY